MFRIFALCLLVQLVLSQPDFGVLSNAKPADSESQAVADAVKSEVETKNGAGSLTLYKVIQYKIRFVDVPREGGGLTGGIVYYMKIEASEGNYIQVDVLDGDGSKRLSGVKATTKEATITDPFK